MAVSLGNGTPGSHVPHESLDQAHAASTPVTARTVSRSLLGFVPSPWWRPGSDDVVFLSTPHQRFTFVRLPDPYLTESRSAFSWTAHHLGSHPHAAPGGLRTGPVTRPRRACLHLSCSKAAIQAVIADLLFAPSWRNTKRKFMYTKNRSLITAGPGQPGCGVTGRA